MRSSCRLALAAAVVLSGFASAEGAIRFVNASAPAGGDGQTWATAYKYLQDALTAARATGSGITEIWVAAGTYQPDRDAAHPTGTRDRYSTFALISGVAVRGGFAGNEDPATFDLATRNFVANKTTLSGDLAGNDGPNFANNSENTFHVVMASTVYSASVDGFTVAGGNTSSSISWGAGMQLNTSSPTIMNCIFTSNSGYVGGAVSNEHGANPQFIGCTFAANRAVQMAGAVENWSDSSPTFNNCTFLSNTAPSAGAVDNSHRSSPAFTDCTFDGNTGTAIINDDECSPVLTRCTFSNNTGGMFAGAVDSLYDSNSVFDGCVFVGNSSLSGGGGGALYCQQGVITVRNCSFSLNTAKAGGAVRLLSGQIVATSCTFLSNSATPQSAGGGGAVSSSSGQADFVNCVFDSNRASSATSAAYGGAIYTNTYFRCVGCRFTGNQAIGTTAYGGAIELMLGSSSSPELVNCTFTRNMAVGAFSYGGAAYFNMRPNLTNCIVWGNAPDEIYGLATARYSCIRGGWTGEGNIGTDPRISVTTGKPRPGSPCIDAGSNSAVPTDVTTDLAGNPRFVDDPDTVDTGDPGVPARAVVDMGAYEYAPVPTERLYVNAYAEPGGDGASWSTACRYLQDAFAAAEARAGVLEIWVARGVYQPDRDETHPNGTGLRSASFNVPGAVAVLGGFPGQPGQEGDLTVRNPALNPTYLSGDLLGNDGPYRANNSDNSYHVLNAGGTGPSTVLDGFRVTGGNANGAVPDDSGGGLYAPGGSPTVRNCLFVANAANANGGGLYASAPVVTDCGFAQNSAASGGGVYNSFTLGSPTLTNCTVAGNTGGGVYISGANTSQVSNSVIWGNTGLQLSQTSGSPSVLYSCIQGGWPGTGNIAADPLLTFVAGGDLRLRKGSPCVDAGLNARVPTDVTSDASGAPRFVDDPDKPDTGVAGGQGGVVDIGACEYQPGPAKRLYVQEGAVGGDGLSQATAYAHLQDALWLAQSDPNVTEIWVGAGVYRPDRDAAHPAGTGDRNAAFIPPGAVPIYGGFPAAAIDWSLDNRDAAVNPTVLSGDLAGDDGPNFTNNAENSYHVVDASWTTAATVLDGLNISSGNANGTGTAANGGGMYIASGGPTVNNCMFTANAAGNGGGLHMPSGASPVLTACDFTGNKATMGGGIWNSSSTASIASCTFSGNSATTSGGGLFNMGSTIKLVNGVFSANTAPSGGGVYSNGGGPALVNCTLFGNSATTAGGGVFGFRAALTLTNCILWGNTAPTGPQIGGAATTTYSCVQAGATGQGNTSLDPLFVNAPGGDLRLSATSPCIDAGSNTALPSGTLFDAAGRVRFMDIAGIADCPYTPGTCGTTPIVDMGAYEFIPAITGDFDFDGDVDESDMMRLTACAAGPSLGLAGGCELRILDGDDDIDLDDFGILQRCYSGYARAADPNCGE